jgi:hypothetical protein
MTHIIRQQFLHIKLNGTESDGLALQRRLPDLCHHRLMPSIERALDRCTPQNGHLTIERLEIDAGALSLDRLEHDLAESVSQAIEKSLRELYPPDGSPAAMISGNAKRKTDQQSILEAFIHFLNTGSLPWSFHLPEGRNLEQTILDSWRETPKTDAASRSITAAVLHALDFAAARKRLIYQFSPVFNETLSARLSPKINLPELLAHHLCPESAQKVPDNRSEFEEPISPEFAVSKNYSTNIDELHEAPEISPSHISERTEIKEGIFIDHAGLVLLHPFLPRFFEVLGIATGDKLLQSGRALCLLHYLATGQPFAPEYELILPKILCNVPVEAPVAVNAALTTAEREEAGALLEAVVRHWDALQNTSVDTLRGTFLVRSGKVSMRDSGDWRLQIESKSCDILLENLPWGIGMIKLPWMDKLLWVEWNNGAV